MRLTLPLVCAALLTLQGCASALKEPPQSANFKCIDAAADATSFGRVNARAYARAALFQELPEAKGFLISSGVRRVKVVSRRVDCRPSALSPALSKCTAYARLCGR